jgi:hypothetical protein
VLTICDDAVRLVAAVTRWSHHEHLFTIGHSTRTIVELVDLLRESGVDHLVDVRSMLRSRNTHWRASRRCVLRATALSWWRSTASLVIRTNRNEAACCSGLPSHRRRARHTKRAGTALPGVDDFYDGLSYWLTQLAYEDKPPVRAHPLEGSTALLRNPLPESDLATA